MVIPRCTKRYHGHYIRVQMRILGRLHTLTDSCTLTYKVLVCLNDGRLELAFDSKEDPLFDPKPRASCWSYSWERASRMLPRKASLQRTRPLRPRAVVQGTEWVCKR
jgi:hypothetical protein